MRCIWCNQDDGSVREVTVAMIDRWGGNPAERPFPVHASHEEEFRRFAAQANQNGRRMVLGIVGVSMAMLLVPMALTTSGGGGGPVGLVVGGGTALIGVMAVVWPFATPETVRRMGIERSIRLVRAVAGAFVLVGLMIAVFAR